jgi:dTDP-4-dehydrorhamnose 3,5-epimerase
MTQHLTVPSGSVRFVIHDDRPDSPTQGHTDIIEIGDEDNYCLLKIPPMLWYGFKGVAAIPSLIANCADMAHSPEECERAEMLDNCIPYSWGA